MKKRIGTLKGKPIVEGGGSNIIKENEININDIGSSSDSNDDDISYFGIFTPELTMTKLLINQFSLRKLVDYLEDTVIVSVNDDSASIPDMYYFYEVSGNINNKTIYTDGNWIGLKDYLEKFGLSLEIFKPISKEDFYRTNYTKEEAEKIAQEYYNHYLQNAPSETK